MGRFDVKILNINTNETEWVYDVESVHAAKAVEIVESEWKESSNEEIEIVGVYPRSHL